MSYLIVYKILKKSTFCLIRNIKQQGIKNETKPAIIAEFSEEQIKHYLAETEAEWTTKKVKYMIQGLSHVTYSSANIKLCIAISSQWNYRLSDQEQKSMNTKNNY